MVFKHPYFELTHFSIFSMLFGLLIVVKSSKSLISPEAICLRIRRKILPDRVLGKSGTIVIMSGLVIGLIVSFTCFAIMSI